MKIDKSKAKTQKKQNPLGRPRLKIDINILANLAQIGCPDYEIAKILNISPRTLSRNYAEFIDENREKGKASLRKKMWDKALKKDNTMMQIWLSKNYLGFKDKIETTDVKEPIPLVIEAEVDNG